MTELERKIAEKNGTLDSMYSDRIVELLRLKYSLNDELAIQRQRDEKPDDFQEYFDYVEACKVQARKEIFGEDIEPLELSATTKEYLAEMERLGV